jgi:hypothetical protein
MKQKPCEGSPEWFRLRREVAANYLRALDSTEQAGLAIDRMLRDWNQLDDDLKCALLYSAIIHYARPFCFKKDFGGKRLHKTAGFDSELHEHLINLRNNFIGHQNTQALRAIVGHGYADINLSGTATTVLIATHCVVKALHNIENRQVAERYANHIRNCNAFLRQLTNKHLETLHDMALRFPENAAADTNTLLSNQLPIEQSVFQTRVPTALETGAQRIPNPAFPLPGDAYKYRVAGMTHFRVGRYEIQTPLGTAIIELNDQPFPIPIPL